MPRHDPATRPSPSGDCLDVSTMRGLAKGTLSEDARMTAHAHLASCEKCKAAAALPTGDMISAWLHAGAGAHDATARAESHPPESLEGRLSRGDVVGRYVIDGQIGAGGMGVVYAAYDPELDRKVALKMVHADVAREEISKNRLLREAQAMARLSHPNVVVVHDIGVHEGELFLAMEFVEGVTLRSWLSNQSRSWRKTLQAFVLAGRGLAAAHAVGLVHRDFKPENVLCDRAGRVCVTDFGLARRATAVDPEDGAVLEAIESAGAVGVTRSGVILGTPAYMAPEQHSGQPADARGDQFSFCVALYEALYHEHPFYEGPSAVQHMRATLEGLVREAPARTDVPSRIRKVLLRGLSVDPAQRYGSMDELLAALTHDPAVRRRRIAFAAGGALAVIASVGVYQKTRAESQLVCKGSEQKLSGVWDEARKRAVHDAFSATGKPFAGDVWRGVERSLDGYARSWTAARTDACEATRLRGEQSVQLLDRRMACFGDRLDELRAMVDAFAGADGQVVTKATGAAEALTPIARCNDTTALLGIAPPPESSAKNVASVRTQLTQVNALRLAGKYPDGLALAKRAVEAAAASKYPPIEGEAHLHEALVHQSSGDYRSAQDAFNRAAWAADRAGDDRTRAEALTHLIYAAGAAQSRLELVPSLDAQAKAAIARIGGDEKLEGLRLTNVATAMTGEGKFAEAIAEYERARPLIEKIYGPESVEAVTLLNRTANAKLSFKDYDGALELLRRALDIGERALGAAHPLNALAHNGMGIVLANQLKLEDSAEYYRRALALNEQPAGYVNLGDVLIRQGKYDEARGILERALKLREAQVGPDSPRLIYPLCGLGQALVGLRDYPNAKAVLERALRVRGDPQAALSLAEAKFALARALSESGADKRRARAVALEAREIYTTWPRLSVLDELDRRSIDSWLAQHPNG
jgi:eukaryotic-like serine/threonine-protein kinase